MIEMESFEKGMGVLAERFRAPLAPEAQKGYYAILSEELETEQFRIAVKLAFRHSQFWPSPQQLIDFVKPPRDLAAEALDAFERVRALGFRVPGIGDAWRREEVAELGDAALAAFTAIGGQERLRNLEASDLPFCRREFVAVYKATAQRAEKQLQIENAEQAILPAARRRALRAAPIGDVIQSVAGVEAKR